MLGRSPAHAMLLLLSLLLSLMLTVVHGVAVAAPALTAQIQPAPLASPVAAAQPLGRSVRELSATCRAVAVAGVFLDEIKPQGRPPLADMVAPASSSLPAKQLPPSVADEAGKKPCWPPALISIAAVDQRVPPQSIPLVDTSVTQGPRLRPPCPSCAG